MGLPGVEQGEPRVGMSREPPACTVCGQEGLQPFLKKCGPKELPLFLHPRPLPVPLWGSSLMLPCQGPHTLTECSAHAQRHPKNNHTRCLATASGGKWHSSILQAKI